MSPQFFDFAIIGAGIAGASIAAELASHAAQGTRITLLEAEDHPGYHATGRSAAFWEQCYGGPEIVPLTVASGPYLKEHGFLSPRGALYIARDEDLSAIEDFEHRFSGSGAKYERIGTAALAERIPRLKTNWRHAIWQPECADIDVAALHQYYLKRANACRVSLHIRFNVAAIERVDTGWRIETPSGERIAAGTIVNAAGAWADSIAAMASLKPKGITPLRRTVAQLRTVPPPPDALPLVLDINGAFYFKPENGRLWLSPHDETPSEPCDAAPEELDIATAIDRFGSVVDWSVEAVERKWAGLRSFAPDRLPVYGCDPDDDRFFWFAGQGGYGIQTAPAAARLAAQLITGAPRDAMTEHLDEERYAAKRFA